MHRAPVSRDQRRDAHAGHQLGRCQSCSEPRHDRDRDFDSRRGLLPAQSCVVPLAAINATATDSENAAAPPRRARRGGAAARRRARRTVRIVLF